MQSFKYGKKEAFPQHTLEVDTWTITYDKDNNLIETEGEKKQMEEVNQLKYLGFVIADNASNVANILDKKNKSINTIRNIMNIIQGLETYTIQNGMI